MNMQIVHFLFCKLLLIAQFDLAPLHKKVQNVMHIKEWIATSIPFMTINWRMDKYVPLGYATVYMPEY